MFSTSGFMFSIGSAFATDPIILQSQRSSHWQFHKSPNADEEHEIVFAIRQDSDLIEKELMSVSTPGSSRFRQFLNFEEVGVLAGTKVRSERVSEWISERLGVSSVVKQSPRGEFIRVRASVTRLEHVFGTNFHHWKSEVTSSTVLRCEKLFVPANISNEVHTILGTVDFPAKVHSRQHVHKLDKSRYAHNSINPNVLRSFYHMGNASGSPLTRQSVFETSTQGYSPIDLAYFQGSYGIPVQEVTTVLGGHNDSARCYDDLDSCGEANLDVQYLMAVSPNTNTTFFWTEDKDGVFVEYMETMASQEHPPEVNSISWGSDEAENPVEIMQLFNTEVMKLGLMGSSVFVSSGDDGIGGREFQNTSQCKYVPQYPASSPYVTTVGATSSYSWASPGMGEVVCQMNVMNGIITSGGGFSEQFEMPTYQQSAVNKYFTEVALTKTPKRGYNIQGRGYPDVALSGYAYEVFLGGHKYHMFGTSASAPAVAGMVSLVNSARRAAGAGPLGFLNPAIYTIGAADFAVGVFNDVTEGQNQCTSGGVCCEHGFYAAEGWDPATGFGSINFKNFMKALTSDLGGETLRLAEQYIALEFRTIV